MNKRAAAIPALAIFVLALVFAIFVLTFVPEMKNTVLEIIGAVV